MSVIIITWHQLLKVRQLGLPNSSRELFELLFNAGIISEDINKQMQGMVGFRNIAVHDYQNLNIEIVISIVENHLKDFERFTEEILSNF